MFVLLTSTVPFLCVWWRRAKEVREARRRVWPQDACGDGRAEVVVITEQLADNANDEALQLNDD